MIALWPAQDLPNQVRHWDVYTEKIGEHGVAPGSYLNPLTAEWFSGQQLRSFEIPVRSPDSSFF